MVVHLCIIVGMSRMKVDTQIDMTILYYVIFHCLILLHIYDIFLPILTFTLLLIRYMVYLCIIVSVSRMNVDKVGGVFLYYCECEHK